MKLKSLKKVLGNNKKAIKYKELFGNLSSKQQSEIMNILYQNYYLKNNLKNNTIIEENMEKNDEKDLLKTIEKLEKELNIKEKENTNQILETERKILKDILPVIDSLELSLSYIPNSNKELKEGLENTLNKFYNALLKYDIEPVQHEKFDPEIHEAISVEYHPNKEKGDIIKVLQKGFQKKKKLIRPGIVTVSG